MRLRRPTRAALPLGALVLLYAAAYGWLAIRKHDAFQTANYDLGNMDQAVWNTLQGRPLLFTLTGQELPRLIFHWDPILVLLAPLYLVWDDARALLALQAVVVALGAVPIYLVARRRLGHAWLALLFAAAYLALPYVQGAALFEFHGFTLAPPLLAGAVAGLEYRRPRLFAALALGALLMREDVGLIVLMLGLYAVWCGHRRLGAAVSATGLLWFVASVEWLIPAFSPEGRYLYWQDFQGMGSGAGSFFGGALADPLGLVRRVLLPEKAIYVHDLLLPLGYLPLLGLPVSLLDLPHLAINLLSSRATLYTVGATQYSATIAPFLTLGAVVGVARIRDLAVRRAPRMTGWVPVGAAVLLLMGGVAAQRVRGFSPLNERFFVPAVGEHTRLGGEIVASIPRDARVSAQPHLVPHLTHRRWVYSFPDVRDADFVLLDVLLPHYGDSEPEFRRRVMDLLAGGGFGVRFAADGYLVLERGAAARDLPPEFYSYAYGGAATPEQAAAVLFESGIEFLGLDPIYPNLYENERGLISFTTYWRARGPLFPGLTPVLYFVDGTGQPFAARAVVEAEGWLPPGRWEPERVVRLKIDPPLWLDRPGPLGIYVGVARGDDPWAVERRLGARLRESSEALRLLPGQRLVRVAELPVQGGEPGRLQGGGEPRQFNPPASARPVGADLETQFRLEGYTLQTPATLGGAYRLDLVWQALAEAEADFAVFVHLYDAAGAVVAQSDGQPVGGSYPTSAWRAGEYVLDSREITVPEGRGRLQLAVGLYNPATGRRLVPSGTGAQPDGRVMLGEVPAP